MKSISYLFFVLVFTVGFSNLSAQQVVEDFEGNSSTWTWKNVGGDSADWIPNTGTTPTPNTGPMAAASGTQYAYVEADGAFGATAILESPCYELEMGDKQQLQLPYYMFGSDVGSLRVEISTNGGNSWDPTPLFQKSFNQGNSWKQAWMNITSYFGDTVKFRVITTVGNGSEGDIAIDAINFRGSNPGLVSEVGCATGNTNIDPTVSITSPNNGDSFTEGDNVNITATASDSDGMIDSVSFFYNNSPIGTDDTAPYTATTNAAQVGTNTIKAVATDDQGATAESTININVVADNSGGGGGSDSTLWVDSGNGDIYYNEGKVSIGTNTPEGDFLLTVAGEMIATRVKISPMVGMPDYVFAEGYQLLKLKEIAEYIKEHKHLPEIPSAKEVEEKGLYLDHLSLKLLQKIEELTLYMIEHEREIEELKIENEQLKAQLKKGDE